MDWVPVPVIEVLSDGELEDSMGGAMEIINTSPEPASGSALAELSPGVMEVDIHAPSVGARPEETESALADLHSEDNIGHSLQLNMMEPDPEPDETTAAVSPPAPIASRPSRPQQPRPTKYGRCFAASCGRALKPWWSVRGEVFLICPRIKVGWHHTRLRLPMVSVANSNLPLRVHRRTRVGF